MLQRIAKTLGVGMADIYSGTKHLDTIEYLPLDGFLLTLSVMNTFLDFFGSAKLLAAGHTAGNLNPAEEALNQG